MDEKRLVDGATALAEKQSRVIKIEPAERPQNVRLRVAAYGCLSSICRLPNLRSSSQRRGDCCRSRYPAYR